MRMKTSNEQADVGFFAIDPKRGATIAFTAPYVLIEGCYLVRADSPIATNAKVDQSGVRVVLGKGSAYDLYLSRELRHAEIVRAPTSPTVVRTFLEQGAEVAAGVRQQLESDAAGKDGLRLLGERFMVIRQAMGVPRSRGARGGVSRRFRRRHEGWRGSRRCAGATRHPGGDCGTSGRPGRIAGPFRFWPGSC